MFGKVSSRLTTRERVQRTDRRGDERMVSQTSVNETKQSHRESIHDGEKTREFDVDIRLLLYTRATFCTRMRY